MLRSPLRQPMPADEPTFANTLNPFDRFITHLASQPIFPMLVICMCFGAAAVVGAFERPM